MKALDNFPHGAARPNLTSQCGSGTWNLLWFTDSKRSIAVLIASSVLASASSASGLVETLPEVVVKRIDYDDSLAYLYVQMRCATDATVTDPAHLALLGHRYSLAWGE